MAMHSRVKSYMTKLLVSDLIIRSRWHMPRESTIGKLTDAVFGFALAVGALSLTIANLKNEEIIGGLLLFSLSFIILVVIWWGTSNILSNINQDTR
jgi:uncharacterized membrane protein